MSGDILQTIIEYVWVPIVTALGLLWGKFVGMDMRTRLLEQAAEHYRIQRAEDKKLRDEQRKEILDRMDKHQSAITAKLDDLNRQIKNGH